mgnify:CR=1 FL=1
MTAIPVIDIAPGAAAALAALRKAAGGTGFFLVTGHGVDEGRARTLYDTARAFFDLQGRGVDTAAPPIPGGVGYAPLKAEALAATRGEAGPGDLKQSLNYGSRLPAASPTRLPRPAARRGASRSPSSPPPAPTASSPACRGSRVPAHAIRRSPAAS